MNGKVIAHLEDGSEVDVTEGVRALYDLVINSMDWGSGFLTADDAAPVVHVAKTLGFEDWERAEEYVAKQTQSTEQAAFLKQHEQLRYIRGRVPHDHVWSSIGRCMWPECREQA